MNAFLTGSTQYGTYDTPESDIDLVILVDKETKDKLIAEGGLPCRFGKLNLILATTQEEYAFWLAAKLRCVADSARTKEEVIAIHDGMRGLLGLETLDLGVSKRRSQLIAEGEMKRDFEPSSYRRWGG